ncbi:unnamed protein product [Mytilus edulis]|uniref:J domain-containing protein n=2 Tax=Mytilus TaxID=6548 RepID=A0A8B6D513_MYTGA|nr:unnamed protein product [Mytilus edulis]VDI13509.1 Hypothetical predicted protein [Mytilus galloprovincialis]
MIISRVQNIRFLQRLACLTASRVSPVYPRICAGQVRTISGEVSQEQQISPTYYYDVLGVNPRANEKDINNAYYKLVKKYHPTVNPTADAITKFQEICRAYDVLSIADKRKVYDDYLGLKKFEVDDPQEKHSPDLQDKVNSAEYRRKLLKGEEYEMYKEKMQEKQKERKSHRGMFHLTLIMLGSFVLFLWITPAARRKKAT